MMRKKNTNRKNAGGGLATALIATIGISLSAKRNETSFAEAAKKFLENMPARPLSSSEFMARAALFTAKESLDYYCKKAQEAGIPFSEYMLREFEKIKRNPIADTFGNIEIDNDYEEIR
jgi:hypothetical protein